MLKNIYTVHW